MSSTGIHAALQAHAEESTSERRKVSDEVRRIDGNVKSIGEKLDDHVRRESELFDEVRAVRRLLRWMFPVVLALAGGGAIVGKWTVTHVVKDLLEDAGLVKTAPTWQPR